MQSESTFITIQDWMMQKLKLTGNELIIYALIHGYCQNGYSTYYGSLQYISDLTGLPVATVHKILKRLTEKKLLVKIDVKSYTKEIDGKEIVVKAHGGSNHFCKYYTVISRTNRLQMQETSSSPLDETSNVPIDETSNGNSITYAPIDETANEPIDETSNAPIDETSNNNKFIINSKNTTTVINPTEMKTELFNLFGGDFFHPAFIKKITDFLNSKKIDISIATKYIDWCKKFTDSKNPRDKLAYFSTICLKDNNYNIFVHENANKTAEKQQKKIESSITCPACHTVHSLSLTECPKCKLSASAYNDKNQIAVKQQIIRLPASVQQQINAELNVIDKYMVSLGARLFMDPALKKDIDNRRQAIYQKYKISRSV